MMDCQPSNSAAHRVYLLRMKRLFLVLAISGMLLLATGCHRQTARVAVPPPPETPAPAPSNLPEPEGDVASRKHSRPIYVETGMASWYAAPYQNRRSSNGEVYNMNALTAAHRTLPLNSIARITNVRTGRSAVVRITDRGPFIPGRVLDLSLAAARKLDVWQPGVAEVKVELMQSASPDSPGKWAVQIGGFPHGPAANKLADHLQHRYHTAKVLCFASPAGDWWIRVRVLDDDHDRAQKLAAETETPEGSVFLVRLD